MKKSFLIMVLLLLTATMSFYGCDGGGGDGGGGGGAQAGNKTIVMNGGNGNNEYAGDGGDIYLDGYRDIIVSKTGGVNAGFSLPANTPKYIDCTTLEEGAADPMEQFKPPVDVTIKALSSGDTGMGAGGYYLLFGNNDLKYDSDGGADAEASDETVECIDIPNGVTVTVELNYDYNYTVWDNHVTGADTAYIYLDADLRVAGTLKVATLDTAASPDTNAGAGMDSGMLQIYAHQVWVTSSGTVDATGADNASGRGGHGGDITLESYVNNGGYIENLGTIDCSGGDGTGGAGGHACADSNGSGSFWASDLYFWSDGVFVNKGKLIGNGGNGDAANNGGDGADSLYPEADFHVYSTGTLEANGGNGGPTGYGGDGGYIEVGSYYGEIGLSGTIDASGGDGGYGGGDADELYIWNDYASPVKSSATITMAGGNATADGDGGDGAYFDIYYYVGPVALGGSFDGSGGDAAGTGNYGGDGDEVYIEDYDGYMDWYSESYDPYDTEISMTMDMSGGDGDYGGYGGDLTVYADSYSDYVFPPAGKILLKGYASFDISGGDSTGGDGGDGGYYEMYTEDAWFGDGYDAYVVGSTINHVPVDAHGGNGSMTGSMSGGQGGWVQFEAEGEAYMRDTDMTVAQNLANLDLSGGNGDYGGDSGGMYLYGFNEAKNTGAVDVSGGNGTTDAGEGLDWYIEMYSSEDVINSGNINGAGGTATTDGGDVYDIYMYSGQMTKNSGNIDASGGNATTNGGYGGWIELGSQGSPTSNSGSIDVAGGTGTTEGDIGTVLIDYMDVTDYIDGKL